MANQQCSFAFQHIFALLNIYNSLKSFDSLLRFIHNIIITSAIRIRLFFSQGLLMSNIKNEIDGFETIPELRHGMSFIAQKGLISSVEENCSLQWETELQ
jgi:hypothetical protein